MQIEMVRSVAFYQRVGFYGGSKLRAVEVSAENQPRQVHRPEGHPAAFVMPSSEDEGERWDGLA